MESIQSAKAHLKKIRANRKKQRELKEGGRTLVALDNAEDGTGTGVCNFACLNCEGVLQDLPVVFKSLVLWTGKKPDLDRTEPEKTRLSVAVA